MDWRILLLLVAGFAGANAGEIADGYRKQQEEFGARIKAETNYQKRLEMMGELMDRKKESDRSERLKRPHEVTEIGIEHRMFVLIVKSDGTCRYHGNTNLPIVRLGRPDLYRTTNATPAGPKTGRVRHEGFEQLAAFVREIRYSDFKSMYGLGGGGHGLSHTYTTAVVDGIRKTILNRRKASLKDEGPVTLWALERLLEDLKSRVNWDEP